MTSDDDRIAYLAGDAGAPLDPDDQADLDVLRDLLADPSVWAEPNASLEDRIVAAIAAEVGSGPGGRPLSPPPPRDGRGAASHHVPPSRRRLLYGAVIATAAVVAAIALTVSVVTGSSSGRRFTAASVGHESGAGGVGHRHVHQHEVGLADRPTDEWPGPPRQRPLLPGVDEEQRGRPRPHRHVQPGTRGDPLVRCDPKGLPGNHGHRAGSERQPGFLRTAGAGRQRRTSGLSVAEDARTKPDPPLGRRKQDHVPMDPGPDRAELSRVDHRSTDLGSSRWHGRAVALAVENQGLRTARSAPQVVPSPEKDRGGWLASSAALPVRLPRCSPYFLATASSVMFMIRAISAQDRSMDRQARTPSATSTSMASSRCLAAFRRAIVTANILAWGAETGTPQQ